MGKTSVNTNGDKRGELNGEDSRSSAKFPPFMILLDHIVNIADGRADEEGKAERDDVPSPSPDVDVNRIEHRQEGETPPDPIDDRVLAGIGKLIDDITEEQEVD